LIAAPLVAPYIPDEQRELHQLTLFAREAPKIPKEAGREVADVTELEEEVAGVGGGAVRRGKRRG
jgi:hypothetical protein